MTEPSYLEVLIPAGLALLGIAAGCLVGLLIAGTGALWGALSRKESKKP